MQKILEKHGRKISIMAPLILGGLYMLLCAVRLQQSIWFDESYSAYLTRFSFGDIWNLTAADVHPPLYYFLLKIWSELFGSTDFSMRFMSVFFGAVAIIFAWQWIKHRFGLKAALGATLLMAISPMFIRYGQEMRMYTMTAAIIFAATYSLQRAIDTKKKKFWLIYGVLIALGMWTHYFVALIWIAQFAYLIYVYGKKIWQKNIIQTYLLAILLYLPWLPVFIFQTKVVQQGFWIKATNMTTVTDYLTNTFLYLDSNEVTGWVLLLMLAVLAVLIFLIRKTKKKLSLLNFMAFLAPVLLILLSMPPLSPMFVDRYVIYSSICLSILVGAAIALIKFKKQITPILLMALFVLSSVIGIINVYTLGNYNKITKGQSDAKGLFEAVAALSRKGEAIVSHSEWLYYDLAFYGNEEHPVYFNEALTNYRWGSHEPLRQKDFGKIKDFEAFLNEQDRVWLVGYVKKGKELDFKYDGYTVEESIYLDINTNQDGYQILAVRKS